jgi:HD superfamily phosphohydrolase
VILSQQYKIKVGDYMFYATGEEKTKEDYEILQQEIEAYRTLDGQSFRFGNELIVNDDEFGYGSEDGYLGIVAQDLREKLEYWHEDNPIQKVKNKSKKRLNKYERRKIDQQKLKRLSELSWCTAYYCKDRQRYIKIYYSGRRKYAKYCSKRKVRNSNDFPLKGNGYRKVFDYWWTIF